MVHRSRIENHVPKSLMVLTDFTSLLYVPLVYFWMQIFSLALVFGLGAGLLLKAFKPIMRFFGLE